MAIDTIKSVGILDGSIATADIADDAVTSAKVADDAITSAKLDTNIAVGGTLGVTGAITGTTQTLNGANTDGELIGLQRGGSAIGSIGTANTDDLYILNSDTGLMFSGGSNMIIPRGTAGAARDNAINLGAALHRFKDLYLSSGLYVGGTGAANHLDDYEEGTWTPSIQNGWGILNPTTSTATGHYTKIGNLVYVLFKIVLSGGSTNGNPLVVIGSPFSSNATSGGSGVYDTLHGYFQSANSNATNVLGEVGNNGAVAIQMRYRVATGLNNFTGTDSGNSGNFTFSGIYRTDS